MEREVVKKMEVRMGVVRKGFILKDELCSNRIMLCFVFFFGMWLVELLEVGLICKSCFLCLFRL